MKTIIIKATESNGRFCIEDDDLEFVSIIVNNIQFYNDVSGYTESVANTYIRLNGVGLYTDITVKELEKMLNGLKND